MPQLERCSMGQNFFQVRLKIAFSAIRACLAISVARRVARNSQWGSCFWGLGQSPQPQEANEGLGAKPPAAGGWGLGGKVPSRRRQGSLGAEPPALENFAFFAKITSF